MAFGRPIMAFASFPSHCSFFCVEHSRESDRGPLDFLDSSGIQHGGRAMKGRIFLSLFLAAAFAYEDDRRFLVAAKFYWIPLGCSSGRARWEAEICMSSSGEHATRSGKTFPGSRWLPLFGLCSLGFGLPSSGFCQLRSAFLRLRRDLGLLFPQVVETTRPLPLCSAPTPEWVSRGWQIAVGSGLVGCPFLFFAYL